MSQNHDHNCFFAAFEAAEQMKTEGERVGYFLYVAGEKNSDAHYFGNTAFAAGVFMRLVRDVGLGHQPGTCAHCDRVAMALKEAEKIFRTIMDAHSGATC